MDQKHCTLESIDLSGCIILDKDFAVWNLTVPILPMPGSSG